MYVCGYVNNYLMAFGMYLKEIILLFPTVGLRTLKEQLSYVRFFFLFTFLE